jgi:hypothetical protein
LKETRFKSYLVEMAELLKMEEKVVGIQKIAAETKVT